VSARFPAAGLLLVLAGALACGRGSQTVAVPGREGARKTAAVLRAERRAYDGAPPVIPHRPFGAACVACHTGRGMNVPDVGFAPPLPHAKTAGMSLSSRCTQCHVFRNTDDLFVKNTFTGLRQDLRHGRRLNALAPPVLPHPVFMRENCLACHSGPAAREEIRTDHPERVRCLQCHVPRKTTEIFAR